jgi:hypothetical protein
VPSALRHRCFSFDRRALSDHKPCALVARSCARSSSCFFGKRAEAASEAIATRSSGHTSGRVGGAIAPSSIRCDSVVYEREQRHR